MVSKQALGRVTIIPKGTYNPTIQYQLYNLVNYQGNSYLATKDNFKNILPTNTSYWQLVAAGGGGAPFLTDDSILYWTT